MCTLETPFVVCFLPITTSIMAGNDSSSSDDDSTFGIISPQARSPRKHQRVLLTIGVLSTDFAAKQSRYASKWALSRKGGKTDTQGNNSIEDVKECQVSVRGCPSCLPAYCIIYEPVAYTPKYLGNENFWLKADFVHTFFQMCHHATHKVHKGRILYLPIPPTELQGTAPPSHWIIPPTYNFKTHTTILIQPINLQRHFVVIVIDLSSRTIEIIDGFWSPESTENIAL